VVDGRPRRGRAQRRVSFRGGRRASSSGWGTARLQSANGPRRSSPAASTPTARR
jgi:hypothetical protein